MKILLLSWLLAVFVSPLARAQSNFVDAKIVTLKGDTISEMVDNRDWKRNPLSIDARTGTGEVKTYSALDIKGFYLIKSKEWYHAAIVTVDKSSLNAAEVLKNVNRRGPDTDTIFLKTIIKGRLSLYLLFDEFSRRHLITEKAGYVEELKIEKKRVLTPKEGVVVIPLYKDQLTALVSDCSSASLTADKVQYSERSVSTLVSAYNNCFNGGMQYLAPVEKTDFRFSVVAGVHHSTLNLGGLGYGSVNARKYNASIGPVAGVALDVIFPRNRRSFSIYNEILYRSYSMEDVFNATQLKALNGFRYHIPGSGLMRIFVGALYTNAIALAHKYPEPARPCTLCKIPDNFRSHEQGFGLDAGTVSGKFQYLIRFERTNGFTVFPTSPSKFDNFYATVSYSLSQ